MGWQYYNHAMIPDTPPHEDADVRAIKDGSIWRRSKGSPRPLLARYTTDYDCAEETGWWYVIKDDVWDVDQLSAKRRYGIKQARRYFTVRLIDPAAYGEELYTVQSEAFSAYPAKYRPHITKQDFLSELPAWEGYVFGAFYQEPGSPNDGLLCGYSLVRRNGRALIYIQHKVRPAYEKKWVNHALIDGLLTYFADDVAGGSYISNGQRSTNHETQFNEFLEKNFLFRRAYCRLHVAYPPAIRPLIPVLYAMRKILSKGDGIGFIHQINAVLTMEHYARQSE